MLDTAHLVRASSQEAGRAGGRIDDGTGRVHPPAAVAETDDCEEPAEARAPRPEVSSGTRSPSLTAPFVAIAGFIAVLLLFGRFQPTLFGVLFLVGFPLLFGWATAALVRSKGGAFSSGFLLGAFLGPLGLILAGLWKPDPRGRPHHSPFGAAGTEGAGMAPQVAATFAEAEVSRRRRLWILTGILAFYAVLWTLYLTRGPDVGGTDSASSPALELVATGVLLGGSLYVLLSPGFRRRRAMRRAASSLGLRFAPRDPFNLLAIPIPAFRRQRAQLRNVLWGTWRDQNVVVFENANELGCLVQVAIDCPAIAVYPENRVTMAMRASGLRDIELESEAFNRAFTVKCDDLRFASAVMDGRMMAWLLEQGSRWGFEMVTGWAFSSNWTQAQEDPEPLLGTAAAFVERIPRAVWDLYRVRSDRAADAP